MEAELKCVKAVESMEEKLRTVAHSPNASFDQILLLLNGLTSEYERSSAGPTKWQKLAKFLQQSLQSSLHDVFKREHDQALSKHTALELKCRSMEDKISLISRQADAAQRDSQEWKRRYETAMADFKSTSEHSSTQNAALQNKISKIEEKCISLSEQLEAAMKEAAEWRSKYDHIAADSRTEKERRGAELMALQSKYSAAEARLAAAREQSEAAKEEAAEWRRKHDAAVTESRVVIDKATLHRDRAVKQAQQREDAVRAELSVVVDQKEKEVRQVQAKLEESDHNVSSLKSRLQEKEAKLTAQVEEIVTLQAEVRHLQKEIVNVKNTFQIKQRELDSTYQERAYIEENLNISVKKLGETEEKCTILQNDAKRAADEAEKAKKAATTFEREKLEAMRLAVERLALIERAERQCEALERDKQEQLQELERLKQKEREAVGMAASLEKRLEEGEHEMEQLLNSAHKQRANTVEVLEGLLATERAGHAEANARAEALSVQLQTVQNKLDKLQHELTTVRLNETAAETKLRVYQAESSGRRKRPVTEVAEVRDSVEEMDIDFGAPTSLRKKPRFDFNVENGNSPRTPAESDSKHEEDSSKDVKDSQDYLRFTIPKLKQELVNAGFAEELFLLRNPSKKNILSLYEKCILHK
ncbi:hypothetical protein O6H91_11G078500 [Diphasiastrum complanatum]|nr:hypothetical protein O6H91_11G078500 [Diphasiastrum complanatum]